MHTPELLNQTVKIVSSHLANNPVPPELVPALIRNVYRTLTGLGSGDHDHVIGATPGAGSAESTIRPIPAVPINKSVTPSHIICLEDGRRFKTLKRHLQTAYDMTPDEYRKRWGLPADYPMVAPDYAQTRSALAKVNGLGRPSLAEVTAPLPSQSFAVRLGPGRPRKIQPSASAMADVSALRAIPNSAGPVIRQIPEGVSSRKQSRRGGSVAA